MTREEVIKGLQYTIDMFLFDPLTGETLNEPRNDLDKTTIDSCREAIKLLEQGPVYFPPCVDCNNKMNEIREAYDKLKSGAYSVTEVKQ